jgi:mono/diheme cytochrome c family protein
MIRQCGYLAPIVICTLTLGGCNANLPGKPSRADRPVPAEKELSFTKIFDANCAGCHGQDGKLGPAPPLNDPLFRAIVPATALEKVLSEGRHVGDQPTPMPPFARRQGGTLSPAQIQVLIHEIKGQRYKTVKQVDDGGKTNVKVVADNNGIAPKWGSVAAPPSSVPPYQVPSTAGDAKRGVKAFARACAGCHGDNGKGDITINDVAFLALISDQALRRIMITGRPDLHMPNYAEKHDRPEDFRPLDAGDLADLGAVLSAWRRGEKVAAK